MGRPVSRGSELGADSVARPVSRGGMSHISDMSVDLDHELGGNSRPVSRGGMSDATVDLDRALGGPSQSPSLSVGSIDVDQSRPGSRDGRGRPGSAGSG